MALNLDLDQFLVLWLVWWLTTRRTKNFLKINQIIDETCFSSEDLGIILKARSYLNLPT